MSPINPRALVQQMVASLPPVDLSKVTFTVSRFAHYPDEMAPTGYVVQLTAIIVSTGQTFPFNQIVPLSAGNGKTQEQVVQWLWEQPETQLKARQLQRQYVETQAAIAARGGKPVELPPGDVTGKPFVPTSD